MIIKKGSSYFPKQHPAGHYNGDNVNCDWWIFKYASGEFVSLQYYYIKYELSNAR